LNPIQFIGIPINPTARAVLLQLKSMGGLAMALLDCHLLVELRLA
jgi:hypothetical protein